MSAGVDAHIHLDRFDHPREAWVEARASGVRACVISSADPHDWDAVEALGTELGMPWTLGVHPWWDVPETTDAWLESLASRPTPHGLGETGLDYVRARKPEARAQQLRTTAAHLSLARERGVPVVFHCVRAAYDLIALLKREPLPAGGLVHSWTGPPDAALQLAALGLHLSFSPRLLRSPKAQASARAVPRHRLLLETDAPDGGGPRDLRVVATQIAVLRGESLADVWRTTSANAAALFPLLSDGS